VNPAKIVTHRADGTAGAAQQRTLGGATADGSAAGPDPTIASCCALLNVRDVMAIEGRALDRRG
jgi:hypothetical protein